MFSRLFWVDGAKVARCKQGSIVKQAIGENPVGKRPKLRWEDCVKKKIRSTDFTPKLDREKHLKIRMGGKVCTERYGLADQNQKKKKKN